MATLEFRMKSADLAELNLAQAQLQAQPQAHPYVELQVQEKRNLNTLKQLSDLTMLKARAKTIHQKKEGGGGGGVRVGLAHRSTKGVVGVADARFAACASPSFEAQLCLNSQLCHNSPRQEAEERMQRGKREDQNLRQQDKAFSEALATDSKTLEGLRVGDEVGGTGSLFGGMQSGVPFPICAATCESAWEIPLHTQQPAPQTDTPSDPTGRQPRRQIPLQNQQGEMPLDAQPPAPLDKKNGIEEEADVEGKTREEEKRRKEEEATGAAAAAAQWSGEEESAIKRGQGNEEARREEKIADFVHAESAHRFPPVLRPLQVRLEAVDEWHAQVLVERKLDELNSARFRDELKQALAQPLNNKELKKSGIDLEKGPAAVHQAELRGKQLELRVKQLEHDRAVAPVAPVQSNAVKPLEFEVKLLEHNCIDSPQLHASAWLEGRTVKHMSLRRLRTDRVSDSVSTTSARHSLDQPPAREDEARAREERGCRMKGRRTEAVKEEPVEEAEPVEQGEPVEEEEPVEERPASASVTRVTGLGKTAVPLFQTSKEKERQQFADTRRDREREREANIRSLAPKDQHTHEQREMGRDGKHEQREMGGGGRGGRHRYLHRYIERVVPMVSKACALHVTHAESLKQENAMLRKQLDLLGCASARPAGAGGEEEEEMMVMERKVKELMVEIAGGQRKLPALPELHVGEPIVPHDSSALQVPHHCSYGGDRCLPPVHLLRHSGAKEDVWWREARAAARACITSRPQPPQEPRYPDLKKAKRAFARSAERWAALGVRNTGTLPRLSGVVAGVGGSTGVGGSGDDISRECRSKAIDAVQMARARRAVGDVAGAFAARDDAARLYANAGLSLWNSHYLVLSGFFMRDTENEVPAVGSVTYR